MTPGYHDIRLPLDERRDKVWQTLWRVHFRHHVPADGCVLDLGAGYGHFINNVTARRRIAIDVWEGFTEHLAPGVEAIVGNVTNLSGVADGTIDYAFASNLFEHMSKRDFAEVLLTLRKKLTPSGILTILQPNYYYAYREYFDDYTHVSIYSHVSISDFLAVHDFEILELKPRFLPLTVKSRLPVWPPLLRAYLRFPVKPFGKQMLVVARPRGRNS